MTFLRGTSWTPETFVVLVAWLMLPIVGIAGWLAGNGFSAAIGISAAFALLGLMGLRQKGASGKVLVGQGLVGQAIALTAAFAGHAWQLDSHMVFFAALAALVALGNIPTLLLATATIAVHHLALSVMMPALIYPSVDLLGNIGRTLFHAAVVIAETLALCGAVRARQRLDAKTATQTEELQTAEKEATQARDAALAATKQAEAEREEAQAARLSAEAATEELRSAQARAAAQHAQVTKDQADAAERDKQREAAQRRVVDALREGLNAVSQGDLCIRLNDPFEAAYEDLRHDFNQAVEQLGQVLATVTGQTVQIDGESSTIEQVAKELSARTERQAASLEETAAALEELTALVKSSSENADTAASSATKARSDAETSGAVVERASAAMDAISASAKKIEKIIDVIDEIAFQTNLLALNAGVEAARAGEAGRGFMVVASEVRALAQRSSEAAQEIGNLITTSQAQVKDGVVHVAETVDALKSVTDGVTSISEGVEQIALSAREQSSGLGEINTAVGHLDTLTQQNSAIVDKVQATSLSLRGGARDLQSATGRFQIGGNGPVEAGAA